MGEQQALRFLANAGVTDVTVHTLEHDIQNNDCITRPNACAKR